MPSNSASPYFTTWEAKSWAVWGWSAPGYRNPRAHEKMFALKEGGLGEGV